MNAVEIEEAISVLAEKPFDAQELPYAFLEAFGNKATAKLVMATNGNELLPENLNTGETIAWAYKDYPDNIRHFLPLAGGKS